MTIVAGHKLKNIHIITPFCERSFFGGLSYGCGPAGYDIRLGQDCVIHLRHASLGVSLEHIDMPNYLIGKVHDKSTWARQGLTVQNTIIEPGWRGYLTLELIWHKLSDEAENTKILISGTPIAQIIFEHLDEPAKNPYAGKYQDQPPKPIAAILR